ncbi:MAG: amino acid adenylation domain-containing protein [Deltaproteobacteria bacterium]|nr:amino acid adenylation domain-containing protein [Deltaproteobacteria bacterium]
MEGGELIRRLGQASTLRPNYPAVEAPEGTYSFLRVEALSNALAHRLRALGAGAHARIGVSLERGARELVALLAVLKCGGAYIPLVPSHPIERLKLIIEDADPELMIVEPGSPLATNVGVPGLVLDDLDRVTAGISTAPIATPLEPDQLAYLMFTSGSTGRPKGVEVRRSALDNFLASMAHTPGMTAEQRLLAITTSGFDISGLELFLPLWVGGTVVIASAATARDPRLLLQQLERDRIDILQATPATWRLLLESGWTGDRRLKMLCGGEALSKVLADKLLAVGGELWNMFGPTETTIWSTVEQIVPGYDRITIGRPIDQTQIQVVGPDHASLPPLVEGELAIGGAGLARGYRGRPELTQARFVAGPNGDRLYLTGDLARMLPDGRCEWLGRLDHQVKIRGVRIELGEIESVLRLLPGVTEVLVVAETADNGDARLVAYWTGPAERRELIAGARRRLPGGMVPSAWVALPAFPLNTNGKIDRHQLPKAGSRWSSDRPPVWPDNDLEVRIAAAWCRVLDMPEVMADEDFFTLGGTSQLAVQVILQLEQELHTEISLQTFFLAPTVAGLAQKLAQAPGDTGPIMVQLQHSEATEHPLFCLFGIALYQDLARALVGRRVVVGAHVPVTYAPHRQARPTIEEISRRYVELVQKRQAHGPYDLLGLCFGGIVAYEVARQLEALGEEVHTVTVINAVLPSGVRVHRGKKLLGKVETFLKAADKQKDLELWLHRQKAQVQAQLPILGKLEAFASRSHEVVELSVDGPEAEQELESFAATDKWIKAALLVVRGTEEHLPSWMEVDADLGWGGRASRVTVKNIDSDHLGVLREPYVQGIAQALLEATPATVPR